MSRERVSELHTNACQSARNDAMAATQPLRASHRHAFSLIELIVTLSIITLLLALLVPTILRARSISDGVTCLSNLRQIAMGFSLYSMDNCNRLPKPDENSTPWEYSLRRYLPNPKIFECPGDHEIGPIVGSSYDWRDTGIPATTMAGKPMFRSHRQRISLAFEALPGWHTTRHINTAWLDMSVHSMDEDEFLKNLDEPVDPS